MTLTQIKFDLRWFLFVSLQERPQVALPSTADCLRTALKTALTLLSLTVPMSQLPRTCALGSLGWSLPSDACEFHPLPPGNSPGLLFSKDLLHGVPCTVALPQSSSLTHTWVLGSQKGLLEGPRQKELRGCKAVQPGHLLHTPSCRGAMGPESPQNFQLGSLRSGPSALAGWFRLWCLDGWSAAPLALIHQGALRGSLWGYECPPVAVSEMAALCPVPG